MKCLTCNRFQTVNALLARQRVIAQLCHYEGDKVHSVEEGELLGTPTGDRGMDAARTRGVAALWALEVWL
jgi:hypothetical protein